MGVLDRLDLIMILESRLPDGRIIDENDARAVALMVQILEKRSHVRETRRQQQRYSTAPLPGAHEHPSDEGPAPFLPLHFVVAVMRPSSLAVISATANNNGATVQPVLCNELESGAISQILWNPDLLLVYHDFLEPSWGVQLDFVEPGSVVPLSTKMNFAYVQEKTKEYGAIALGVSAVGLDVPPLPLGANWSTPSIAGHAGLRGVLPGVRPV